MAAFDHWRCRSRELLQFRSGTNLEIIVVHQLPDHFQQKKDSLAVIFLSILDFTQCPFHLFDVTVHLRNVVVIDE